MARVLHMQSVHDRGMCEEYQSLIRARIVSVGHPARVEVATIRYKWRHWQCRQVWMRYVRRRARRGVEAGRGEGGAIIWRRPRVLPFIFLRDLSPVAGRATVPGRPRTRAKRGYFMTT